MTDTSPGATATGGAAGRRPTADDVTGVLVVANSEADDDALDAAVGRLRAWRPTELRRTEDVDECRVCVADLDGRLLVAAGGDGTLSALVGLLHDGGLLDTTRVGLLPMGTGNDFARTLGLSLEAAEVAEALAHRPREWDVDLLLDGDGATVVNAVHAGIGADAAKRSTGLKDVLGPAAYPVGAVLAGLGEGSATVTVELDGEKIFAGGALMVGVGNGRTIGGGRPLAPDAQVDDGLLDLVIAEAGGVTDRVAYANALRRGDHTDLPHVHTHRGREVRMHGDAVRYVADGEISEPRTASSFTVLAGVLRLLVPAGD